jgi:hypothetical protein
VCACVRGRGKASSVRQPELRVNATSMHGQEARPIFVPTAYVRCLIMFTQVTICVEYLT